MDTINDALFAFKENVDIKKDNTRRLYHRAIDAFGEYVQATASLELPIQSLKKNVVAGFSGWMVKEKGYSAATQKLYRSVLRAALRYWRANHDGWICFTRDEELEASRTSVIGHEAKADSRHSKLPANYANVMLTAAYAQPLPPDPMERLDALRLRALVVVLRATALRISDACQLTREDIENARLQSGRLEKRMRKTGESAHLRLGPETLQVIDEYLQARDDHSPWLFIQHGKSNKRAKAYPSSFFKTARRGYGAVMSTVTAWRLIQDLAVQAGFDRSKYFTSPHAFRHWHAVTLIDAGVSLENVQAVLGHSTPATTKKVYAPEPNRRLIDQAEETLQALPKKLKRGKK